MAFLNPLVLLALAAAAIPIVIHLFNFRKARRVDYSSLQFLRALQRNTLRRVRVERWLLLLFRILTIVCLIAAFARPVMIGGIFTGDAKVSAAIVIDNSLSMVLRDNAGSYIEQARAHAQALAAVTDEVYVLTTAPGPIGRGASARSFIDAVVPQAGTGTVSASIARAAQILEEEASFLNREIYFVGDLQGTTLSDTTGIALDFDREAQVVLVPVGGARHENISIEDVAVTSRIVEMGDPVGIQATLRSFRESPTEDFLASLYLGEERVAQQNVNLGSESREVVSFMATPDVSGWIAGRVVIEDDAFEFDNEHHFTLHVPQTRRVLTVRGPGANTTYVSLALTAQEQSIQTEAIESADLARTSLEPFDAVVMVAPQALSTGEVASLIRYVGGGGGLILFSGESIDGLGNLLEAMGAGRISSPIGATDGTRPLAKITEVDAEHPLFEGVFEDVNRMEEPAVYRTSVYAPQSGAEQALLRLSNGLPFLQEIRSGGGRVMLFLVSPDPAWSDLPVRGLFVPLLYRAVHYVAAGESVQGDRLRAGEPASILLGNIQGRVHIIDPLGGERIPEQRSRLGATLLEIGPDYNTTGVHDLVLEGTTVRKVAMNVSLDESNLTLEEADEAATALSSTTGLPVRVIRATTTEALDESIRTTRTGKELWRIFLVLALIFMGLEMIVSVWRNASRSD